jgi:hypothetical protein
MAEKPSSIKQLSLIHMCKIGLKNNTTGLAVPCYTELKKTKKCYIANKLNVKFFVEVPGLEESFPFFL